MKLLLLLCKIFIQHFSSAKKFAVINEIAVESKKRKILKILKDSLCIFNKNRFGLILNKKINLRQKKWLMCCGYNPNNSLINKFTHDIGKVLDSFIGNYDNLLIVGGLNFEIAES